MKGELLYTRLNKLGKEFTVDLSALTHNQLPADRVDISILYGGKSGQLFPRISDPRLVSHGFDHWMIPNSQYHPFLPPSPGWPGLMLRSKGVDDWKPKVDGGFRVIIKREPSFFEYVGQYEMINLGNVSVEEWKAQPAMVFGTPRIDRAHTDLSTQGESEVVTGCGGWTVMESNYRSHLPEGVSQERAFRQRGQRFHREAIRLRARETSEGSLG